jgi:hypothetical protein
MKVNIENYTDDGEDQVVEVQIDPWDTWSMDYTLAYIVLPMLKQLKETKHGAPNVDSSDVPEELRMNDINSKEYWTDGTTDANFFKRWDWVLDEMIYAFDCKANKEEVYMRFDDALDMNREQERISNGFRLFGKYYENLWD